MPLAHRLLLLMLCLSGWSLFPQHAGAKPDVPPAFKAPVTVRVNAQQYQVAIASTPADQEQGLMYQAHLPAKTGMLFSFSQRRPVAFWMKNTLIPLDMLFIENNRVVQIVHKAQPCKAEPCTIYSSERHVDSVLELPGGTAQQDKLKLGDYVQVLWLR